jgi:hypothetical protein
MQDFVIKFSEGTSRVNLFAASLVAAFISVYLSFFPPVWQFISSALFFGVAAVLYSFCSDEARFNRLMLSGQALLILLFGVVDVDYVLTAAGFLVLYGGVVLSRAGGYILAFLGHLLDFLTTSLAVSSLEEANPVMRYLFGVLGVNTALFITKVVLIGSLLIYSWRKLEGELENLFINCVIVIGFSMAARNTLLILGI